MNKPIVWTIAGSDSSSGAGIQADLQVFQNLGVHGCSVITAITAQNSHSISAIQYVPAENVAAQIAALKTEFPVNVIKLGMLGNTDAIDIITHFLQHYSGKIILDPVMIASSGQALFMHDSQRYVKQLTTIFPHIDLLTPNIPEAETILGQSINSYADIENAARNLLSMGSKSVLLKGGHLQQDTPLSTQFCQDYWSNGSESFWLAGPRYPQKNYRGTGCVYASAIAACLSLGYNIKDAMVVAKMYVNRGIRLSQKLNADTSLIAHAGWPEEGVDLPYLSHQPIDKIPANFPNCSSTPLGLYPIVDGSRWLQKLLPLGVKTIQLRIKNKKKHELENEIRTSVELAKVYNARFFVNDYWELALAHGAYGVHLGQEDLTTADIEKIRKSGLRLGISTHSYYEVARANTLRPSYMACGPVFPTTSKHMAFAPQGINNLQRWRRTLSNDTLVAIGGIDHEKISSVLATGVDGIAMISAITQAENPIQTTQQLLKIVSSFR